MTGGAVLAACLVLAQVGVAVDGPGVDVRLTNGRVIHARSAVRIGDEVRLTLASGTMSLPASRVVAVTPREAPRAGSGVGSRPDTLNVLPPDEARSAAAAPSPGARSASDGAARDAQRSQPRFAPTAVAALRDVAAIAAGGDLALAEARLRNALVTRPDDELARVALGEVLATRGRFAESVAALTPTVPRQEWLRHARDLALARSLSRLDRAAEAVRLLDATPGGERDPRIRAAREQLASDVAAADESVRSSSPHFFLQAPSGTDRAAVEGLLRELESAWRDLEAALGSSPHERVVVILYPGTEFWETTRQGSSVIGLYDGKVRVPAGRIEPPSPQLRAVLKHELTHAFVDALSGGRADRDWQEGLAEHFEAEDISGVVRDLAATCRRDPSHWPPAFSHAVAHARMEWFLDHHGMARATELLSRLARRASLDQALRDVVGSNRAELDAEWCRALSERGGA